MPPRVALVASTYRSRRFLTAWFESMTSQAIWHATELIVVANAPDPEERALLQEFANGHEQVHVVEVPRESLYRSWNRGIAETTAPLVGIANVDDLRTADGLEAQVDALEQNAAALFSYGPFSISRAFPPGSARLSRVVPPEFERERFTREMHAGPFFVWRRAAVEGACFDEQLKVGGDFDLVIRLAFAGSGVRVDVDLGFYYDGGTGLSTSGDTQAVERTVLELRYGIYDKLDYRYIAEAAEYVIPQLRLPDGWVPLAELVPDIVPVLEDRRRRWFRPPRRRWLGRLPR